MFALKLFYLFQSQLEEMIFRRSITLVSSAFDQCVVDTFVNSSKNYVNTISNGDGLITTSRWITQKLSERLSINQVSVQLRKCESKWVLVDNGESFRWHQNSWGRLVLRRVSLEPIDHQRNRKSIWSHPQSLLVWFVMAYVEILSRYVYSIFHVTVHYMHTDGHWTISERRWHECIIAASFRSLW